MTDQLPADHPDAGTIRDPNVDDPYGHLVREGSPDLYADPAETPAPAKRRSSSSRSSARRRTARKSAAKPKT